MAGTEVKLLASTTGRNVCCATCLTVLFQMHNKSYLWTPIKWYLLYNIADRHKDNNKRQLV